MAKPKAVKKKREPRLNVQGLARKEQGLMECLLPDNDDTAVVSVDLVSAEPTVTCHFSGDPMYRYACFDGVGQAPFYKLYSGIDVLMVDDIYLMCMSASPIGKDKMWEAFNTTYGGRSFVEQWLLDSEVIKKELKKFRQIHKIMCLGLGYSMGPKKLVKQAYENGYTVTLDEARKFFKIYWKLFEKLERLGRALQAQFNRHGYLVNPFGYRLVPDKKEDYKCLNYFIQSSISGIMHVLCHKYFSITPYAELNTIIHDEIVMDIPKDKLEPAQKNMIRAVNSMNAELKWSVPIRTGWVVGANWYEAK